MNEHDYAVIVGVNHYLPDSGLKNLNGAINDADKIEAWITSPEGANIPKDNVKKIISVHAPEDPTPIQSQVDKVIGKIIKTVIDKGEANRLYFYFAGHGFAIEDNTADTALCMADWTNLFRGNALSCELYKRDLSLFGLFNEILIFADCCRNLKTSVRANQPRLNAVAAGNKAGQEKTFIAFATQFQNLSMEVAMEDEVRGIFTTALLDGLHGGASDQAGVITADSLRNFIKRRTSDLAEKKGYNQKSYVNHSYDDTDPVIIQSPRFLRDIELTMHLDSFPTGVVRLLGLNATEIVSFDAARERSKTIKVPRGWYTLAGENDLQKQFFVSPVKDQYDVIL